LLLGTLHGVIEVRLGLLGASRGGRGLLVGALSVLAHVFDLLLGSLASSFANASLLKRQIALALSLTGASDRLLARFALLVEFAVKLGAF
jgi:hypothetical protein